MSSPRSLANTPRPVSRLEAERYQCALSPRLPRAVKWSASSAADAQSLRAAIGFQVDAERPSSSSHERSRSRGAKTQTGPRLDLCPEVRLTSSSLVEVATTVPNQVSNVGTTTLEVLPERWTPSRSTLSSAGACKS